MESYCIKTVFKLMTTLRYKTPKGKYVYGGGGIIPDIFVGIDTTQYLNTFLFNSITNFSFDYVDKNRKALNTLWTLDLFLTDFDKDNSILESYLELLPMATQTYYRNKIDFKSKIKTYVKATIAREIFGDEGFYRSIQKDDAMLQKVLELDAKKE